MLARGCVAADAPDVFLYLTLADAEMTGVLQPGPVSMLLLGEDRVRCVGSTVVVDDFVQFHWDTGGDARLLCLRRTVLGRLNRYVLQSGEAALSDVARFVHLYNPRCAAKLRACAVPPRQAKRLRPATPIAPPPGLAPPAPSRPTCARMHCPRNPAKRSSAACILFQAAKDNCLHCVRKYLEEGLVHPAVRSQKAGKNVMDYALQAGAMRVVQYLRLNHPHIADG